MPDDPNSTALQHTVFFTATWPTLAIPSTSFFTYILNSLHKLRSNTSCCKWYLQRYVKILSRVHIITLYSQEKAAEDTFMFAFIPFA